MSEREWQDIETAPKDRPVWAWCSGASWDAGEDVVSMRYVTRPFAAAVMWYRDEWEILEPFDLYVTCTPTH